MSGSRSGKPLRLFYLFSVVQNPIIKTAYSRIQFTGGLLCSYAAPFYSDFQRCFSGLPSLSFRNSVILNLSFMLHSEGCFSASFITLNLALNKDLCYI